MASIDGNKIPVWLLLEPMCIQILQTLSSLLKDLGALFIACVFIFRCYSFIGKSGNRPQQVSIGTGCTSLGTVTHEIGIGNGGAC